MYYRLSIAEEYFKNSVEVCGDSMDGVKNEEG